MAASLGISSITDPAVWGIGSNIFSRLFLVVNAMLCFVLAHFVVTNKE
jgi:serine protease